MKRPVPYVLVVDGAVTLDEEPHDIQVFPFCGEVECGVSGGGMDVVYLFLGHGAQQVPAHAVVSDLHGQEQWDVAVL